jgi:hypothetical protein
MSSEDLETIEDALFEMGVSMLDEAPEVWTFDQRLKFEHAMKVIDRIKNGNRSAA